MFVTQNFDVRRNLSMSVTQDFDVCDATLESLGFRWPWRNTSMTMTQCFDDHEATLPSAAVPLVNARRLKVHIDHRQAHGFFRITIDWWRHRHRGAVHGVAAASPLASRCLPLSRRRHRCCCCYCYCDWQAHCRHVHSARHRSRRRAASRVTHLPRAPAHKTITTNSVILHWKISCCKRWSIRNT